MPGVKRVAILGASSERRKFGNKSLRAHRQAGWEVYAVNPGESEIEGVRAYASLAELPGPVERVSVYLPPPLTRRLLPEIAAAGAGEVFFNPGAADPATIAEARRLGIPVVEACSIVDLGLRPSDFP